MLVEDGGDKRDKQTLVNVVVNAATIDGLRQERAQRLPRDLVGRNVGAVLSALHQSDKPTPEKYTNNRMEVNYIKNNLRIIIIKKILTGPAPQRRSTS
jgi:hypothetical protein